MVHWPWIGEVVLPYANENDLVLDYIKCLHVDHHYSLDNFCYLTICWFGKNVVVGMMENSKQTKSFDMNNRTWVHFSPLVPQLTL